MKKTSKFAVSTMLAFMAMLQIYTPVFAGAKSTKTGPVFTVNATDTVMNAPIKANQKMKINNKVGTDLELIVDNVYQGYIPNGKSGSLTSTATKNLVANHQIVNGMHVLVIASTEVAPTPAVTNADKTQQIAAIDAQINQLCVYYQQAQVAGDVNLMNTTVQLVQTLNAQKALLMQ